MQYESAVCMHEAFDAVLVPGHVVQQQYRQGMMGTALLCVS